MTTFTEARQVLDKITDDQTAGFVITTSVPDAPVSPDRVRQLFAANGLDPDLVPQKRSEVDDFAIACTKVRTRRGAAGSEGQKTMIEVGEAVRNSSEAVYQITAAVKDETNRVIEHPKAMRAVYNPAKARQGEDPISFEPLDPAYAAALEPLTDTIRMHFAQQRGKLQGSKIRELLRSTWAKNSATRWGKSYFVPVEHKALVMGWAAVLDELYEGKAELDWLRVPRTGENLTKIEKRIGQHVTEDVDKLMDELRHTLRGNVDERTATKASDARDAIAAAAREMQQSYGSEIRLVKDSLAVLDDQIDAVYAKLRVPAAA